MTAASLLYRQATLCGAMLCAKGGVRVLLLKVGFASQIGAMLLVTVALAHRRGAVMRRAHGAALEGLLRSGGTAAAKDKTER